MMTKLVIHIGLRKTATTWLQNLVFPRLSGVNYLGKTEDDYPKWLINWHYLDDFEFQNRFLEIKNEISGLFQENLVNLVSSEAFSNTAVIWSQAHRILKIVPNTRILITLRNPIDTLISHYKLDVADGLYHLPLEEYLDWGRTPYDISKRKPIYLPDFFYNETISLYIELFGKNNVCVLRYEDMVNETENYFDMLMSFLSIPVPSNITRLVKKKINAGLSIDDVRRARAKNIHRQFLHNYPTASSGVKVADILRDVDAQVMPESLRKKLETYFAGKCYGYY